MLAVVSGGILHSYGYRKVNREVGRLNLLSKNTWSMVTFSLIGLIFILLGTQIPSSISSSLGYQSYWESVIDFLYNLFSSYIIIYPSHLFQVL